MRHTIFFAATICIATLTSASTIVAMNNEINRVTYEHCWFNYCQSWINAPESYVQEKYHYKDIVAIRFLYKNEFTYQAFKVDEDGHQVYSEELQGPKRVFKGLAFLYTRQNKTEK